MAKVADTQLEYAEPELDHDLRRRRRLSWIGFTFALALTLGAFGWLGRWLPRVIGEGNWPTLHWRIGVTYGVIALAWLGFWLLRRGDWRAAIPFILIGGWHLFDRFAGYVIADRSIMLGELSEQLSRALNSPLLIVGFLIVLALQRGLTRDIVLVAVAWLAAVNMVLGQTVLYWMFPFSITQPSQMFDSFSYLDLRPDSLGEWLRREVGEPRFVAAVGSFALLTATLLLTRKRPRLARGLMYAAMAFAMLHLVGEFTRGSMEVDRYLEAEIAHAVPDFVGDFGSILGEMLALIVPLWLIRLPIRRGGEP